MCNLSKIYSSTLVSLYFTVIILDNIRKNNKGEVEVEIEVEISLR